MIRREIDVKGLGREWGYRVWMTPVLIEEELTRSVIGSFFEVYNTMGYGFLEPHYVMALERELRAKGHRVHREFQVLVRYKGEELGYLRLDMVVDDRLVVEVKGADRKSFVKSGRSVE